MDFTVQFLRTTQGYYLWFFWSFVITTKGRCWIENLQLCCVSSKIVILNFFLFKKPQEKVGDKTYEV